MEKLFNDLNEAQALAVKQVEGPNLIIAGAGSGKTRVLIYRIAYLLQKGINPSSILALTFTNKAAREMKDRIMNLLGNDLSRYLWMGTFHSIFAKILRIESDKLNYPSTYTIYDTDDSKSLIKSIIKELELDDTIYKPSEIYGRISSAKNNLITAEAYCNNTQITERDKQTRKPRIADIYKLYSLRCKRAEAMDFDDLLLNINILFRDFPDVLSKYQEKFKYILVDEYQDTNYSQYLIVKKLGFLHNNVSVVGDDAQSIYSFRGAMIENILNFKNDYKDTKLYKLEQNYRSTKTIVLAANSLIAKNKGQIHKTIFSDNEIGDKLKIIKALTDGEEGYIVSNLILDTVLIEQQLYSDFAILYRTNAQSRIFEEAMRKKNIPYKIYGSVSFYQRKEIKDVLAYLRLSVNLNDDEALKRIINYPARGIGKTTLNKIIEIANQLDKSIWDVLADNKTIAGAFNKGTSLKLTLFSDVITDFYNDAKKIDAYEIAMKIASSTGILKELYNGTSVEERSRYENLEELLNSIKDFVDNYEAEQYETITLDRYLENVALLTSMDTEKEEDKNKVTIMTMHSAKGLEFNNVFIAGVEEDLFPSSMSRDNPKDVEEERRLFYVAITRARKRVVISYATTRYKWGSPTDCQPSRFLYDIEDKYIDWQDLQIQGQIQPETGDSLFTRPNNRYSQNKRANNIPDKKLIPARKAQKQNISPPSTINPDFRPDDPGRIKIGMKVEHQRFGIGNVIQIEGEFPNKKAVVYFENINQDKLLLLKFAKLRIVETM